MCFSSFKNVLMVLYQIFMLLYIMFNALKHGLNFFKSNSYAIKHDFSFLNNLRLFLAVQITFLCYLMALLEMMTFDVNPAAMLEL
jgi:hypothetical protein